MNNINFIALTSEILTDFYTHKNPQSIIQYLPKDMRNYGFILDQKFDTYDDICHYLYNACKSPLIYEIKNTQLHIIMQTNHVCIVEGTYFLKNNHNQNEDHYQYTIVYEYRHETLFIKHLHISRVNQMYKNNFDIKNLFNQSDVAGLCCFYLDDVHTYTFVNDALPLMLGYDNKEEFLEACHNQAIHTIYKEDYQKTMNAIQKFLRLGNMYHVEYRMVKKDGSLIWVMDQGQRFIDENGEEILNAFISDITSLKQTELDLMIQKQRYSLALKDNSITILEYDIKLDRLVIDIQEESKKKIYDHYLDYVASPRSTVFAEDKQLVIDLFTRKIKGPIEIREHIRGTDRYVRKSMDSAIICDEKGEPVIVLATARDITTEWNHKAILEQKIQRDSLTKLLNLESGKEKIEKYLRNNEYIQCALIILDIDYFKTVNDDHGHLFGNNVLIAFANCLSTCVRKEDIVVRIGGDEFMILLKDIDKTSVENVANKICQSVRDLTFKDNPMTITTSMGVCYLDSSKSHHTFEDLFKNADWALYRAKENGRNRFEICDRLDAYKQDESNNSEESNQEFYNHVLKLVEDKDNLQMVIEMIGHHYHFDRISILKLNEKELTYGHDTYWVSSRAYQIPFKKGTLSQKDYTTFTQKYHHTKLLEANDFDTSLQEVIKSGVAKDVLLTYISHEDFNGCISFVIYNQSRTWSQETIQQINELSKFISHAI